MHKQRSVLHAPRLRASAGRFAGRLGLALLPLVLAACMVGPDHVRPDLPVPDRFMHDDGQVQRAPQPAPDAGFWNAFDDPVLTSLVDEALVANHDLRIALARYDRANALLQGTRFDQLPTVTAGARASEVRASADQAPGVERGQRDGETYSAGIDLAWELDLFGRVRRSVEAGRAETAASAADLAALQVAIAAEVARSYLDLRGLQERLRVARENADTQRETLQIVQARLDAGASTGFDRARASAQLEATLALLPELEAEVAVMMHRLAVLTGRAPSALVTRLGRTAPLPVLPTPIDPGTPGELLRRRPDIAAAEARLHAATARIGVATADLFPRFTLGGLIGSQAIDTGDLFARDSQTRMVALGVDWSFLDAGRIRARIAAADAAASGELARYQQTVLLALEETENALVRHLRARTRDGHLRRAAAESTLAAEIARVRYDAGMVGLFEVLDAERTRLEAQDALAAARTRAAISAVDLYRAMAGGWPGRVPLREEVASTANGPPG